MAAVVLRGYVTQIQKQVYCVYDERFDDWQTPMIHAQHRYGNILRSGSASLTETGMQEHQFVHF